MNIQVKTAKTSMLAATIMLLNPIENRTSNEKTVFTMNNIATNQGAQPLFTKRL